MCRSIRILHHFEPPTTSAEIHDAALQFVRKISGLVRPSAADRAAFDQAVQEIETTTARLLSTLPVRGQARTREGEQEKARARWAKRIERDAKP